MWAVCYNQITLYTKVLHHVQVYMEVHFQAHLGTDLVVIGEAKPL